MDKRAFAMPHAVEAIHGAPITPTLFSYRDREPRVSEEMCSHCPTQAAFFPTVVISAPILKPLLRQLALCRASNQNGRDFLPSEEVRFFPKDDTRNHAPACTAKILRWMSLRQS